MLALFPHMILKKDHIVTGCLESESDTGDCIQTSDIKNHGLNMMDMMFLIFGGEEGCSGYKAVCQYNDINDKVENGVETKLTKIDEISRPVESDIDEDETDDMKFDCGYA